MSESQDSSPSIKQESFKTEIERFLNITNKCLSGEIKPIDAFHQITGRTTEISQEQSNETPIIYPTEITAEQHQTNHEIEEIRQEIIKTSASSEDKKTTPESLIIRDEYYVQKEKELLDFYGGGFIDSHKTQYEEFMESSGKKEKNITSKINSFLQTFRNQIKGRKDAQDFYTILHQRGYSDRRISDSVKELKNLPSTEIASGIDRINKLGLKVNHFEGRESIIKKAASISEEHFNLISKELNPYFFLNDLYLDNYFGKGKELYGNHMIYNLLDIAQEGKISSELKNKLELIKTVYMVSPKIDKKIINLSNPYGSPYISLDSRRGFVSDEKKYHKMIFENQGDLHFSSNTRIDLIDQKDFDSNFEIIYKNFTSFDYRKELLNRFSPEQIDKLSQKDHGVAFLLNEIIKESMYPESMIDYLSKIKDQLKSNYFDKDKSVFFYELFSALEPTASDQRFIGDIMKSKLFCETNFEDGKYEKLFKFINSDLGFNNNELNRSYFIFNAKDLSEFITKDSLPTSKFYETALEKGTDYKIQIPEKALTAFSDFDQKFWKSIEQQYSYGYDNQTSRFRNSIFLKLALTHKNNPDFISENGIPTSKFYEKLLKEGDWFPPEIPVEILSTFSETDQKFWTPITIQLWMGAGEYDRSIENKFSFLKIAIENRNNPDFFNSDGLPTSELYEKALISNINAFRYISSQILESFPEKDQKFWNNFMSIRDKGMSFETLRELMISKKENFTLYLEGGEFSKTFFNDLQEVGNSDFLKYFLETAPRKQWELVYGKDTIDSIIKSLPPKTSENDEARNAFTHNPYDRTSLFFKFLIEDPNTNFVFNKDNLDTVAAYIKEYKLSTTPIVFRYFKAVFEYKQGKISNLPQECIDSKITTLNELKGQIHSIRKMCLSSEPFTNLDLSPLQTDLLSTATGHSSNQWTRIPIETIITDFSQDVAKGRISPLLPEFTTMSTKIDEIQTQNTVDLAKNNSFQTVSTEIINSIQNIDIVDDLKTSVTELLQTKIEELSQINSNDFINKQIETFATGVSNLSGVSSIDGMVKTLVSMNINFGRDQEKYNSILRQLVFRKVLKKHNTSNYAERMRTSLEDASGVNSIVESLNFLNNLVKDHALNFENNKEGYWEKDSFDIIQNYEKVFKKNLGIGLLTKEFESISSQFKVVKLESDLDVEMIPDRGITGELAGYMANVCYTKVYPLLKQYPNVVPYKFVSSPKSENPEIIGSTLVFKVETADSEPVLLIRAFDIPKENTVDIPVFFEKFVESLSVTAKKLGIKKIIAAGTQGTISNYSMTKRYVIDKYVSQKEPTRLKNKFDFNGYDITNQCYLVRDLN